jgi:colicin import membrane protein
VRRNAALLQVEFERLRKEQSKREAVWRAASAAAEKAMAAAHARNLGKADAEAGALRNQHTTQLRKERKAAHDQAQTDKAHLKALHKEHEEGTASLRAALAAAETAAAEAKQDKASTLRNAEADRAAAAAAKAATEGKHAGELTAAHEDEEERTALLRAAAETATEEAKAKAVAEAAESERKHAREVRKLLARAETAEAHAAAVIAGVDVNAAEAHAAALAVKARERANAPQHTHAQ